MRLAAPTAAALRSPSRTGRRALRHRLATRSAKRRPRRVRSRAPAERMRGVATCARRATVDAAATDGRRPCGQDRDCDRCGTIPIGSAKSIGTSTSCVGIATPEPISNSTRNDCVQHDEQGARRPRTPGRRAGRRLPPRTPSCREAAVVRIARAAAPSCPGQPLTRLAQNLVCGSEACVTGGPQSSHRRAIGASARAEFLVRGSTSRQSPSKGDSCVPMQTRMSAIASNGVRRHDMRRLVALLLVSRQPCWPRRRARRRRPGSASWRNCGATAASSCRSVTPAATTSRPTAASKRLGG